MKPRILPLFLLLVVWPAGLPAQEARALPQALTLADRPLVLNGKATRTVWGFPVYQVGLFLEEPSNDPQAIMQTNRGPKRVQMVMLRSVEKEKFVATVRENIEQNLTAEEQKRFASELKSFLGHLQSGGDLDHGRIITIDYLPQRGTVLGLDGARIATIEGDDFYHLMLRLWIGRPLQASIKEGLLGRAN